MLAKVIQSEHYQENKNKTNISRATTRTITAATADRYGAFTFRILEGAMQTDT
jgi:hypothetical protein